MHFDNMLRILIHAKDSEKFAYSADDVYSVIKLEMFHVIREIYAEHKKRLGWQEDSARAR